MLFNFGIHRYIFNQSLVFVLNAYELILLSADFYWIEELNLLVIKYGPAKTKSIFATSKVVIFRGTLAKEIKRSLTLFDTVIQITKLCTL